MASASLGNGGVGSSSRSAAPLRPASSSSVDWLGREMLHMNLNHEDDDDDDEPDIIDGVGAETGHVIRTTIAARNGQSKQVRLSPFFPLQNSCAYILLIFLFPTNRMLVISPST